MASAQTGASQCTFEFALPAAGDARRAKQEEARIFAEGFNTDCGAGQNIRAVNDLITTIFRIYTDVPRAHGCWAAAGRAKLATMTKASRN